jgi:GDSL-like Lipase/Acylhydrolase family
MRIAVAIVLVTAGQNFGQPPAVAPLAESWDYVPAMKLVAAKFAGNEGVVLHVGGSMTIANPYTTWARSGKGKSPRDEAILKWMHAGKNDKSDGWWLCRTELEHYRAYTAESGLESPMLLAGGKRGLPPLEKLLAEHKPRMVTIECGIYDVENKRPMDEYEANMAKAVDQIAAAGAIPILTTIIPFKADLTRSKAYSEAIRKLAKSRSIPVLDVEREILERRPEDWYGKLTDRIHLIAGQAGTSPGAEPTAKNLASSGYLMRCYLTVQKFAEIKERVLDQK